MTPMCVISPEALPNAPAPRCVLDTQAVLDWLYFADPVAATWEAARQAGRWHWVAATAMRDELAHVLSRRLPPGRGLAAAELLACFDARASLLAAPTPGETGRLRCTDPDDQKFIDFALGHRTRWLVSRDRAVLTLARRARFQGVEILPPVRWRPGGG
jgi:predicted nucleic acid-binding protein